MVMKKNPVDTPRIIIRSGELAMVELGGIGAAVEEGSSIASCDSD